MVGCEEDLFQLLYYGEGNDPALARDVLKAYTTEQVLFSEEEKEERLRRFDRQMDPFSSQRACASCGTQSLLKGYKEYATPANSKGMIACRDFDVDDGLPSEKTA